MTAQEQLIDAVRQLGVKPGERVAVRLDTGTVEVSVEEAPADDGDVQRMPSPDPPGTVYVTLPLGPPLPLNPGFIDANSLAPGYLGDSDDLLAPGS